MSTMSREEFQLLLEPVTNFIGEQPLDSSLQAELNREFPQDGKVLNNIKQACHDAIAAGWMCKYEDGGIKYGRVIKPVAETAGFSVDVVQMKDVVGPHHRHPQGEIDLIMPIDDTAQFDQHGEGWLVYAPNSAHHPTVTNGTALVLYLLPNGEIEFTGQ
jgi:Domain of unknown function (DUF4863)